MDRDYQEIRGDWRKPGGVWVPTLPPAPPQRSLCGLDLGQAHDYTALVIAERHQAPHQDAVYHVRHLERFPLGTPYPVVVSQVQQRVQALATPAELVMDATGVGRPVLDLFRQARLAPIGVSIHGGDQVTRDGPDVRVPKRDLVGGMQVLLQSQRLKIAEALPLAQVLVQELLTFKQ